MKNSSLSPRTEQDGRPAAAAPFKPYPLHLLPKPFAKLAREAAMSIGTDPAAVAAPLLVAAGAVIGSTTVLARTRTWKFPPTLWMATVAYSGERKSEPRNQALKALGKLESDRRKIDAEAAADFQAEQMRHELELAAWKKTPEGKPPRLPNPPPIRAQVVADVTIQALHERLSRNPRGLIVSADELKTFFDGHTRYAGNGGDDSAAWLQLYDGGDVNVTRKTGDVREIVVSGCLVSVCGTIQWSTLRDVFTRKARGSGMAARVLLVAPPSRLRRAPSGEVSEATEREVLKVFRALDALEAVSLQDGGTEPREIRFSPEAYAAFDDYINEHGEEQAGEQEDMRAVYAKTEGVASRFALILHLSKLAAGELSGEEQGVLNLDTIRAGIELARWHTNEARRVYARIDGTEEETFVHQLADFIRLKSEAAGRHPASMSAKELVNGRRSTYSKTKAAEIDLDRLATAGVGQWQTPPQGKTGAPPKKRLVLLEAEFPEASTTQPPATGQGAGLVVLQPEVQAEQHDEPEIEEGWIP